MISFSFIEKYFYFFFIGGVVLGFLFPSFSVFSFSSSFFFAIAVFLGCLKIDFKSFFNHLKDFKYIGQKIFAMKIVAPLLIFYASFLIFPEFALGGLLLAAAPSGISNVILSGVFKGNSSLSLMFSVTTHILSPFIIPLLMIIVLSKSIPFDYYSLFSSLILIILVPMAAAFLVQKFFPKFIKKTYDYLSGSSLIFMTLVVFLIIASTAEEFYDLSSFVFPVIYVFLVLSVLLFFGLFISIKESSENKIAVSLSAFHTSNILGLLIATTYFSFEVYSVLLASFLVIDPFFIVYKLLLKKLVPVSKA